MCAFEEEINLKKNQNMWLNDFYCNTFYIEKSMRSIIIHNSKL